MNTSQPHSSPASLTRYHIGDPQRPVCSRVSWGAIIAGAMAGLALYVLFMLLAAGLGLALYSPLTEDNPVVNLSVGALIIHSIGTILALWMGGWVAGRFTAASTRSTAWLHGFCVWCAATVGGILLVTLSAGWMLGGISSLAGSGLSAAADGAVQLASDAMEQSGETIESFVEEAVSALPEDAPEREGIRAKREIGFAVARLFSPMQDGDPDAHRDAAVTALVDHTGMSQAEADRAVTEWIDTFERLKADLAAAKAAAAAKAREVTDSVASATSTFSLWAFVGFLLGALAASWGGHLGAKSAIKCEENDDVEVLPPDLDE